MLQYLEQTNENTFGAQFCDLIHLSFLTSLHILNYVKNKVCA